ncbi:MAG: type II toxin-antitoxin system VapC family toxin [Acidimicrobiales bacterium]
MILVDTGPLVAAANRRDALHGPSVAALAAASRPRFVPGLVIAEVCYLLARDAGTAIEAEFLRSFATGFLTVADVTVADLERTAELVEQYADLSLGGTDACLVALAERLRIVELATLDRRDFDIVRPRHVDALTLIP